MTIQISRFTEVPSRKGGVGGGRRAGENLVAVRGLAEGEKAVIPVSVKPGESFQTAAKRVTSSFHREGALDFPIKTRTDKDNCVVEVYRVSQEPVEAPAAN